MFPVRGSITGSLWILFFSRDDTASYRLKQGRRKGKLKYLCDHIRALSDKQCQSVTELSSGYLDQLSSDNPPHLAMAVDLPCVRGYADEGLEGVLKVDFYDEGEQNRH